MNNSSNLEIEKSKTQVGRLWSVFGFSVILLIAAFTPNLPNILRILLVITGILTITSNVKAYKLNEE